MEEIMSTFVGSAIALFITYFPFRANYDGNHYYKQETTSFLYYFGSMTFISSEVDISLGEFVFSFTGTGFEKKYTDSKIVNAPTANCPVIGVPNKTVDTPVAKQTLTAVANPFRTLSAYLITAATNSPPPACSKTKTHGQNPNP